jgi:RNA polymerase sigma-70 factor (ECF subfamily)
VWWNANGSNAPIDMPRTTHVTDTRLVRRSQQGDRRAFRALAARYDWRLRGLAYALLLDPVRADAVLRAAYIRAWREVVRIDAQEDAAAWLYRVAYNGCIDALRREDARTDEASPTAADAQADVVDALAGLAPGDRVAVVLVDREGFSPSAAARILGLAPGVIETRLAGARAKLTHELVDEAGVSGSDKAPAAEDAENAADAEGVEDVEDAEDAEGVEIRLDAAGPQGPVAATVSAPSTKDHSPNGASGDSDGSHGSDGAGDTAS